MQVFIWYALKDIDLISSPERSDSLITENPVSTVSDSFESLIEWNPFVHVLHLEKDSDPL